VYKSAGGKNFANHQVGAFHDKMSKPGEGAVKKPGQDMSQKGEHGQANEPHAQETHGTTPHPMTGVHAVMITHHGGGKAQTHTHHEGGQIEHAKHESMGQAQDHASQMLPADSEQQPEQQGGDEQGGMEEALSGMMGGDAA
jgi:hypothetical protein